MPFPRPGRLLRRARLGSSRVLACALVASLAALSSVAHAEDEYLRAAPEIREVLDAPPPPSVWLSPTHRHALVTRTQRYPSIETLARPMLKLAGVRIDPQTRAHHGERGVVELGVMTLPAGPTRPVALPARAQISGLSWNPAGTRVALTMIGRDAVELWLLEVASAKLRRVGKLALNPTLGGAMQWMPDGESLLVQLVVPGPPPPPPPAPKGPRIEVSDKVGSASSTYEARDLLRTPHEADLFEHYGTSQLAIVDARGRVRKLGKPAVYTSASPSPDGRHLLVERIERPYSFTRAYWRFPAVIEVWDLRGTVVETVVRQPLADQVPVDGVRTGPRDVSWRPTAPSTLLWVEALDGGDTYAKVAAHDRIMMKPVGGAASEWLQTRDRFAGLMWLQDGKHAIVAEADRAKHRQRSTLVAVDRPGEGARTLWDRSWDDRYGDPGDPVFEPTPTGQWLVKVDDGAIYLEGTGASPDGDRPFLDRLELASGKRERLFRSDRDGLESFAAWLDPKAGSFFTTRETPTTPSNLMLRTLGATRSGAKQGEATRDSALEPLTNFTDPTPQLRAIGKRLVTYERADGVPLSFTLYTPPGWKEGTRLPTVVWAYPLDYTDKAHAGQISAAPQEFTSVTGTSPVFLALQGYAVLDEVAMPVVGPTETAYDDFLPQIEANARAAIDKAVALGVTDRDRVGVMGHSHGGLMTANLLAWTDLFRAGVARSGAYNHTMRPFGFQNERRSLYVAPRSYLELSPVLHADRIDEPLLIVHGEIDANPGTVPLQSEKLFEAVRGTGGTTKLVMLPFESHGYVARESVEHVLAETAMWFDRYVKNAGPRKAKPPTKAAKPAAPKADAEKAAPPAKPAACNCEDGARKRRRHRRRRT
ncbi:MAG: prolyl oligopeptidase family serine peptidase [Nannocystaceae bacterium]|nr:prolyl oligopeptidase family serine peptidase [Nannocystaceae bacterium]